MTEKVRSNTGYPVASALVLAALVPDREKDQVWIFALCRVPFEEGMGGFVVSQPLTLPSGDQPASAYAGGSTALKTISMSCSGKASLDTPIRLLAHRGRATT